MVVALSDGCHQVFYDLCDLAHISIHYERTYVHHWLPALAAAKFMIVKAHVWSTLVLSLPAAASACHKA